jgi:hypothetical protein
VEPAEPGRQRTTTAPWAWSGLAVAYSVLAAYVIAQSADYLNPDGIAYIQVARHYAAGRLDLAVNSYWGPLLSWLIVPSVWLGADPVIWLKAVNALAGLGFAAGAAVLAARLRATLSPKVVFAGGLMLALAMLPEPLTPDMLLACVMTWYFAGAAGASAPLVGAVGGLAYLIKAYAFVFVPVHLAVTAAMRKRGRTFALGLAGMALVSLPWVTVLTTREGRPTFGSASRHADLFIASMLTGDMPIYPPQRPREGRINVWEDPSEISPELMARAQRPLGWRHRLKMLEFNADQLAWMARRGDPLLVLSVGWIGAAIVPLLRGRRRGGERELGAWSLASAAIYAAGYVLVLLESRYLWPIWGLLLAMTARVVGGAGDDAPARARRTAASALLLAALAATTLASVRHWCGPSQQRQNWAHLAQRSAELQRGKLSASNLWHAGLYASFLADSPYLGQVSSRDPQAIARELAPFGPVRLLVLSDPDLARRVAGSGLFTRLPGPAGDPAFQAFATAGAGR